MNLNVQQLPLAVPTRKKKLDDGSSLEAPKAKRLCTKQSPSPGLAPCLHPVIQAFGSPEAEPHVAIIGQYILLEAIEGSQTFRAVHRHTEQEFTCKVFNTKKYHDIIAPYIRLPPHPNIAQIEEVILGDQNAYVFFKRSHGDMHSHVRTCKRLQEEEASSLFKQITEAVSHCHKHGIILRDLKLRKFVFQDKGRTKLMLENLEDSVILKDDNDFLMDKHGCPAYVGPEILNSKTSYSGKAADVWSLGVIFYTMLVGRYPFQDTEPTALFSKIRRGIFTIPDALSPRAKCLIRCLLRKNPAERLTSSEILLHPRLVSSSATFINTNAGPADRRTSDQIVPDIEQCEETDYM